MTAAATLRHLDEKSIYERVVSLLSQCGWTVYRLSQVRASKQSAGVPDIYAMHEWRGALWVEVKRPGGRQSPAQRNFQSQCAAAGIPYACGGVDEVMPYCHPRAAALAAELSAKP